MFEVNKKDFKFFKNQINPGEDTLYKLKKEGKIRAIGLSNETCWGSTQFLNLSREFENTGIASIQNEYSLLCRLYDTDMSEFSHNENIPLLAYSPLAGGVLTGKYLNNAIPKNSRLSKISSVFGRVNERSSIAVSKYKNLSKKYGIDLMHMSLAFCKQRSFMGSVIFGATTSQQLSKILQGLDVHLTDEILTEINQINKKVPMTF